MEARARVCADVCSGPAQARADQETADVSTGSGPYAVYHRLGSNAPELVQQVCNGGACKGVGEGGGRASSAPTAHRLATVRHQRAYALVSQRRPSVLLRHARHTSQRRHRSDKPTHDVAVLGLLERGPLVALPEAWR